MTLQKCLIAIMLNASLSFAACHTRPDNSIQNIDSSKTIQSTELKHNIDTIIIEQGQTLFTANCSLCHKISATDNYLQGVVQRVGENCIKLYLTRQDSLIKAKDKYALEVKKAFGNLGNSHNFDFSDEELNAIIAYLKKYSS
ncbi:MAG TPA: cytochrome c [Chitinophagaceae bacterium]|nr:cytochrome c [Chitinophagaceae bacterium]